MTSVDRSGSSEAKSTTWSLFLLVADFFRGGHQADPLPSSHLIRSIFRHYIHEPLKFSNCFCVVFPSMGGYIHMSARIQGFPTVHCTERR